MSRKIYANFEQYKNNSFCIEISNYKDKNSLYNYYTVVNYTNYIKLYLLAIIL